MDAGEERVTNEDMLEQLRAKARRVHRRAFITALVITLMALVFPAK